MEKEPMSGQEEKAIIPSGWLKPLIVGISWGIGTGIVLALALGVFLWREARPKTPKAWNSSAIAASFDYTDTEGDPNTIVFYYTLENRTDFDYRIESGPDITMNAKLAKEKNIESLSESTGKIDYPIFVPARKRVRFAVHITYPYPQKMKPDANLEERRKYRDAVAKYVTDDLANLNGFELLDAANRYDIEFEPGWKKQKLAIQ